MALGYTKFDFPFIKIMQPSTDLCHTYLINTEKISGYQGVLALQKNVRVHISCTHMGIHDAMYGVFILF